MGITSNLSSAIIIFGIGAIMIIIAGADKKFALSLVALGGLFLVVILIAGAAMGKGFRFSRIMVWLNPEEYADSGGYQVMQGLYAIGQVDFLERDLEIVHRSLDLFRKQLTI